MFDACSRLVRRSDTGLAALRLHIGLARRHEPRRSRLARMAGVGCTLLLAATAQLAAQDATYTWDGINNDDELGSTVKVIGDVNGDGVRDVAVGSPHAGYKITTPFPIVLPDVGLVRIYSGANGTLLRNWYGNIGGGEEFGFCVADAGDNNGDGFDDVLIGVPSADYFTSVESPSGAVELRSGADGSLLHEWRSMFPNSRFGHAVAAGDMDGDGLFDIAIGQPQRDHFQANPSDPVNEGTVIVYRGSDYGLMISIPGDNYTLGSPIRRYIREEWGNALAFVGDTDGDGFGELLASAPRSCFEDITPGIYLDDAGFVLHFEPALGPLGNPFGGDTGDQLGAALDLLGDADGDGTVEFLVGAPGAGLWGEVVVFENQIPRLRFPGTSTRPLGRVVAGIGDASGNGRPDILLGSPLADPGSPFMKINAGVVEVRLGINGTLLRSFEGASGGDQLGCSVDAGVLDTELRDQLVLGAPYADAGGNNRGRAQLFPSGLCDAPASWENFGAGLAGTLGVPALFSFGAPKLGTSYSLAVGNSLGAPTLAYLFLGFAQQSLPIKGGTLLVNAQLIQGFPLPAGTKFLSLAIPEDTALCGLDVFGQLLQLDPGAPLGVSFSEGMRMTLGH
ncbi:MAG: hypothetical protein DHS20C15_33340 [Planctomycetota bacterium]|nr:MAG: hypothetical protein DHS20C15_33340 [Planctomycetota bacterium]